MRQLTHPELWIGTAGDVRNPGALASCGIAAVVDLALNELPIAPSREIVFCRFPLVDGPGNAPWLLRAAVEMTAMLIRSQVRTLIVCGAGMSRSPAIAAMALAAATGQPAEDYLWEIAQSGPIDVSPGLWSELCLVCG